jgi:NAD(P)-dependent dehydrogenase (short-subunit alcohol dehydrogenase family)
MTSLMGSIGDNGSGGSTPYRLSKAALNMASRNLAHELAGDGIPSMVIHPGWVQTDMGGEAAPLTIAESVSAMARTIDGFAAEHSGGFFDRNGERLPW